MTHIEPGAIVKHKKDKSLVRGVAGVMSKNGVRVMVDWDPKDNPRLVWFISAYYRLDLLEVIEEGEGK